MIFMDRRLRTQLPRHRAVVRRRQAARAQAAQRAKHMTAQAAQMRRRAIERRRAEAEAARKRAEADAEVARKNAEAEAARKREEAGGLLPKTLSKSSMAAAKAGANPLMVLYAAPWCGHSKAMRPAWDALRDKFPRNVAEVDCTAEPELCREAGINAFPTVKLFKNGHTESYTGGRAEKDLTQWLEAKLAGREPPPCESCKDNAPSPPGEGATEYSKIKASGKPALVLFSAPWCGHSKAMAPEWEKFAKQHPSASLKIDCTAERELCKEAGIMGYPTMKLVKGGHTEEYKGARTSDAMSAWLKEHQESGPKQPNDPPPAPKQSADSQEFARMKESGAATFDLFSAPWCGHSRAMAPEWEKFAAANPNRSMKIDCTASMDVCKEAEIMGFPTMKLIKGDASETYGGPRTKDAITAWLKERPDGPKPPEPPKPTPPGPGAAALDNIKASGSPTIVLFATEWCGHSRAMAPEWEKFAAAHPDAHLKVDCTEDRALCQAVGIRGFPTIRLVQGDHAEEYVGSRTSEAIAAWLAEKTESSDGAGTASEAAKKSEDTAEPEDESKDEPEDESKNEPEDESKNEPEDESKDEPEDESKDEPEDESKEEPEGESKEEPEDESKDEPVDESKEEPEGESKEEPEVESEDEPEVESKEEPEGESKNEPEGESKDEPENDSKDEPVDESHDEPEVESKDEQAEAEEQSSDDPDEETDEQGPSSAAAEGGVVRGAAADE